MATAATSSTEGAMPQWKRDLIKRRRQQQQQQQQSKLRSVRLESSGGATARSPAPSGGTEAEPESCAGRAAAAVARNMRLEADCLSLCSESDDVSNGSTSCEPEECSRMPESTRLCVSKIGADCDSDSSEELHYGPGIVNKLKSKYLNLTLRENNKRAGELAVGRFRRAASLEDLLDRTEEEKPIAGGRKYSKRSSANWQSSGAKPPSERYRNASRGNESMKRARSVETLLRCDSSESQRVTARMVIIERLDEPVNDRVVLVDRAAVKIESRLVEEPPRPRPINKPKRLKPVLAETERPPPDLVKTTMRIFESGAARRVKPRGEVAAKVATFKTINDNIKAQTNPRKIVAKNGPQVKFSRRLLPPSPKKSPPVGAKTPEVNDGVITEPIVRSVSSVVSKFQQIEARSPTGVDYKVKLSPEPTARKEQRNLELNSLKSPPMTPVSSPRIISPATSPNDSTSSPTKIAKLTSPVESPASHPEPEKRLEAVEEQTFIDRRKLEESPEKKRTVSSEEVTDGPRTISKSALDNIGKAGTTIQYSFSESPNSGKSYLPGTNQNGQRLLVSFSDSNDGSDSSDCCELERLQSEPELSFAIELAKDQEQLKPLFIDTGKAALKSSSPSPNESKRSQKESNVSPPQKQIGIIRPLVSTKSQVPQQNLTNREFEKNLINRVKSIEQQPTKVVVSLQGSDEIQPAKKAPAGAGLWDTKPWNQQNNTMVFNFSNRTNVPDYIENDGLIIRRRRDKAKVGDSGIIVLDNSLDSSNSEESEWEVSAGPPSPCDVAFCNDNVLINGRSNLSRQPRNHKHRIQFDDTATRTFEYPSEASMLEGEGCCTDGETSCSGEQFTTNGSSRAPSGSVSNLTSVLSGSGLGNYTPSKVDLTSEGFELGVTRASQATAVKDDKSAVESGSLGSDLSEVDYVKPAQDAGAWGSETTVDLLF